MTLKVTPIKTDIFHKRDNLVDFIKKSIPKIRDSSIIAVTSKIVSLAEARTVKKNGVDKADLIKSEADHDLGEVAFGCRLTIKHGLFIPSAGIDESNSESDEYILFPIYPYASAQTLHQQLRTHYKVKNLGIIVTDSHTTPLRQGVTGAALSYWGFSGIKNLIGKPDIFGREMKMTKINYADGLAAAAVMLMGEASEQCPLALIENAPVKFSDTTDINEMHIKPADDLYYPIYKHRL